MKPEDIAEKVRFILEPITKSPSRFYIIKKAKNVFINEHVELLLQLESKITNKSPKEFFWQLIGRSFILPIPKLNIKILPYSARRALPLVSKHCDCAFMVYIKTGRIDEVLKGLFNRIKDYDSINEKNYKIIFCTYQILLNEPSLFSDVHLKKIESIINEYSRCIDEASSWREKERRQKTGQAATEKSGSLSLPSLYQPQQVLSETIPMFLPSQHLIDISNNLVIAVKEGLKKVRFERVKQELKGVSSQINQDKKQLISKYKDLKFSADLIEALERIDFEIEDTGSKFSYSKSIGFVRNIYEESLRQVAIKMCDITKIPIPKWTGRGKMGEAIDYLRRINFISDKEQGMLTGFSGLISDTGSHSLTSERYEVRIAKNILVEICSYLTDKIS